MTREAAASAKALRQHSQRVIDQLGLPFNTHLPEVGQAKYSRSTQEISGRALALHAVVAVSYGFPASEALSWIMSEGLMPSLTREERMFLQGNQTSANRFQMQAEALWVFAWVLGKYPSFDLLKRAPEDLVEHFPDLRKKEHAEAWRGDAALVDPGQLGQWLDLAYCLHWSIREKAIADQKADKVAGVLPASIIERRRALEWLCHEGDWDSVSLDT